MLDKPALQTELIHLFNKLKEEKEDKEEHIITLAKGIADAVDNYVRSGEVIGICPPNGGPLTEGQVV